MDNTRWCFERQTTKEKIINQTEDCGVEPDPERERDYSDQGERRRLAEFTECETNIVDHKQSLLCSFITKRDNWIDPRGAARREQTCNQRCRREQKR